MLKFIKSASLRLGIACALTGLLLPVSQAADGYTPYKVDMRRTDPHREIRKSAIMTKVREKYPGRILSIREHKAGGPDCHIVKSMGDDGEFRIIHVACDE